MEVTAGNFTALLPWMLYQISCSSFVAIDLEFSGIAINPSSQAQKDQSLQERYKEVKAAAEKYQILQIGLTICQENRANGTYKITPYNINLSPFVDRALDINRDWTFMSWSMEFLMNHHFSMEILCKYGVRYLSRDEEAQCLTIASQRYSRTNAIAAVDVKATDKETIDFLMAARRTINWWLNQTNTSISHQTPPHKSLKNLGPALPETLNNMEKRLVHQLITAEYPKLKSRSRPMFVQIEFADPVNDKNINEAKTNTLETLIRGHVGCRWIVEALIAGDLSQLPDSTFSSFIRKDAPSQFGEADLAENVRKHLQENRPILVGHNCFMDLIYLYSGFIGKLPDTVEEFQTLIHGAFPNVVDTKYLATHDAGSINPISSLEEVSRKLVKVSVPKIEIDSMHQKYLFRCSNHEAGYDSMLAAIAFMKLSVQLQMGPIQFSSPGNLENMKIGVASEKPQIQQIEQRMAGDMMRAQEAREQEASSSEKSIDLIEFSDSESPDSIQAAALAETGGQNAPTAQSGELVPQVDSEFWHTYGNRLRVFGTIERVVHLDSRKA
ncbi:CAF1 family ribonuclease [Penicillium longicatenatum]|uniref:CAF1 family ribonuclease n=1 Tax=Penicillium longicatenatum TaxID=1561947 RepID=UPI002547D0BD|nr:CAF1 family ribonuclease [Penicillium longicatenatum]KAJ5650371.1 CAF1 family ribonuclease [Penicillium longicatenatum]